MAHTLISLVGVTRSFDVEKTSGIIDVSLSIQAGEFIAVLGASGAGKSTLLNVLGLLDRADTGMYYLNGIDLSDYSERERDLLRSRYFGFVFQSAFVLSDETVLQNAATGLRIQRTPMRERGERAFRALQKLGIDHRSGLPARLLSGGERQRLAIARAVATNPVVLLADEPTGNLDSQNGQLIIDYLHQLNADGTTIIVVTHDEKVAASAHRIIRVADGRLTQNNDNTPTNKNPGTENPGTTGTEDKSAGVENLKGLKNSDSKRVTRRRSRKTRKSQLVSQAELLPKRLTRVNRRSRPFMDDLAETLSAMQARILRTILLFLAFALGVGGLIAAIGVTDTAANQVSARLTAAALDEVRVRLPGNNNLLKNGNPELDNWIKTIAALPHVRQVGFIAEASATTANIRRLNPNDPAPTQTLLLSSISPNIFEIQETGPVTPPVSSIFTIPTIKNIAILGEGAAATLTTTTPGPGSTIWVCGKQINIIGTVPGGNRSPGLRNTIFVSKDVLASNPNTTVSLIIRTEPGFPAALATAIPLALDPIKPTNFQVETTADLRNLRFGVTSDLSKFITVLALVLLTLSTIGAATTMYLSVQARSQEIALRRAIGLSKLGVSRLFLLEGALTGLSGGIIGSAIGISAVLTTANNQNWQPVLTPGLSPTALLLGITTGLISATLPAWHASRQEPATAIRN